MWFIHNLSLTVIGSAGTWSGVFKQIHQIQDTLDTTNTWNTLNTRNTEYIPNLNRTFTTTGLGFYGLIGLFGTSLLVVFDGDLDLVYFSFV